MKKLSMTAILGELNEKVERGDTPSSLFASLKKFFKSKGFVVTSTENTWRYNRAWMKTNSRFSADSILQMVEENFPQEDWAPHIRSAAPANNPHVTFDEYEDVIMGAKSDLIEIEKQGSEIVITVKKSAEQDLSRDVE